MRLLRHVYPSSRFRVSGPSPRGYDRLNVPSRRVKKDDLGPVVLDPPSPYPYPYAY